MKEIKKRKKNVGRKRNLCRSGVCEIFIDSSYGISSRQSNHLPSIAYVDGTDSLRMIKSDVITYKRIV